MNQLIARKETGLRLSSVELSLIVVVIIAPDPTQLNQLSCVELSRIGRYDQGFIQYSVNKYLFTVIIICVPCAFSQAVRHCAERYVTKFNPLERKGIIVPHETVAVDRWAVTFSTARRGLGGAAARPGFSSLYQM